MSFGSSQSTKSTQTTQIDPQLQARQNLIWNQAQRLAGQPYQPFTGQRFEGFNADQNASFDAARAAAVAGQGTLGQAIGGASNLAGFNGSTITPQQAQAFTTADPRMIAAQQIGPGALGGPLSAQGVTAQQLAARTGAAGSEQYTNPWENQVVGTSLADLERARQEAINAGQAAAARAGAFGGSRHGVADSLTNREFANTAASTAAQLRSAGFTTALGFNQADQNRELQAGMANQGAGLQAGIANQNADLVAGQANRDQALRAALANQGADLTAQQANQSAGLAAGTFNAGQLQQGSQYNAGLDLQGQQANQAAAQNAAALRLQASGLLGGFAGQQQQMGALGADLLSRIGGQQQALGQANRDFDYQQFNEARNLPYQNIDLLSRILGGQQYGTTVTGTQKTRNSQGVGSALLGAGLTVGGALLGGGGGGGGAGGLAPAPSAPSMNWLTSPFGQGAGIAPAGDLSRFGYP